MIGFEIIGILASVAGTALSAAGQMQAANAQQEAAEYNAKLMERKANEERASATAKMAEQDRKKRYAQAEQVATAAASGGGVDSPGSSVLDLFSETEKRGKHQQGITWYEGEEKAKGLEADAAVTRYSAAQQARAAKISAGASIISGFSKIAGGMKGSSMSVDWG